MKLLVSDLLAASCYAQLPCTTIADSNIYTAFGTPFAGQLNLSLGYHTLSGSVQAIGSVHSYTIANGTLPVPLCLAPGIYVVKYVPSTVTSGTVWTIPATGGPYTVPQVQGTGQATPGFQVAPQQIGSNTANNGKFLVTVNGVSTWMYAPPGSGTYCLTAFNGTVSWAACSGSPTNLSWATLTSLQWSVLTSSQWSSLTP